MITKQILKKGDAFVVKTTNTQDIEITKEVGGELITEMETQISSTYSTAVTIETLNEQKAKIVLNINSIQAKADVEISRETSAISIIDETISAITAFNQE